MKDCLYVAMCLTHREVLKAGIFSSNYLVVTFVVCIFAA